jgi:hypothetical protein
MFFKQAFFQTFLTLNPLRPVCKTHLAFNFRNKNHLSDRRASVGPNRNAAELISVLDFFGPYFIKEKRTRPSPGYEGDKSTLKRMLLCLPEVSY